MRTAIFAFLLTTTGCGLSLSGLGDAPDGAGVPGQPGDSLFDAGSPGSNDDAAAARGADAGAETSAANDAPPSDGGARRADATADHDASSAIDAADARTGQGGDGAADAIAPVDGGAAPDGASTDGAAVDGASTGGADAGRTPDAGPPPTPCVDGIPAGWTLAVFASAPHACPATFTAHDASGPPVIGPTACSCDCAVTRDGDCQTGTIQVDVGRGADCSTATLSGAVSGGDCEALADSLDAPAKTSIQVAPLPPQGGACTSGTAQSDPTQLTLPAARYCDVPTASAEAVCGGAAPAGFSACIVRSGSVACPAGTPFTSAFTVEDGATVQCTACTACSVATTCDGATLSLFPGSACVADAIRSVPADGNCNPLGGRSDQTVAAIEYTASATTTCTPGTSTASARLVRPVTLCCR
ncbi:MAG: hypothetical protein JOZ69_04820 [Myxococcales bacterium]|nr:hypothetical protein [Myxococcales bacterium]